MANYELRVMGTTPVPLGKLRMNNDKGQIEWTFIPISAGGNVRKGKVTIEGLDSLLINGPGKFYGKPYGRLINFSLYHYNKNLTYILRSGDNKLRCKAENEDFNMDF